MFGLSFVQSIAVGSGLFCLSYKMIRCLSAAYKQHQRTCILDQLVNIHVKILQHSGFRNGWLVITQEQPQKVETLATKNGLATTHYLSETYGYQRVHGIMLSLQSKAIISSIMTNQRWRNGAATPIIREVCGYVYPLPMAGNRRRLTFCTELEGELYPLWKEFAPADDPRVSAVFLARARQLTESIGTKVLVFEEGWDLSPQNFDDMRPEPLNRKLLFPLKIAQ